MSCCKGPPTIFGSATLWKIDKTTGQLVWSADRGANSTCLSVVTEGGDVVIYEGGTYGAVPLSVSKWRDSGSGGERLWKYAKSTFDVFTVQKSDFDDSIWLSHLNTTGTRIDEAGAEINSGTVQISTFLLARMSSGNMNYSNPLTGVWQYDPSFASVVTLATAAFGQNLPLAVSRNNQDGNTGWVWNNSGTTLRQYNPDLTLNSTYSGTPGTPTLANDQRVLTTDKRVYSLSPIASHHTVAVAGTVASIGGPGAFDESNNLYVRSSNAGVDTLTAFDDSGTQLWTRTVLTSGSMFFTYEGGMLLCASGGTAFDLDNAADDFMLAALDQATGATLWGVRYCNVGGPDSVRVSGSHIYVCGNRVVV